MSIRSRASEYGRLKIPTPMILPMISATDWGSQSIPAASGGTRFPGVTSIMLAPGEWRGAGRQAVRVMVAGIILLLLAVGILGWASTKA